MSRIGTASISSKSRRIFFHCRPLPPECGRFRNKADPVADRRGKDDCLFIRCGLLSADRIRTSDIVSIEETGNPAASAAPSLSRLGIEYRYEAGAYKRNGYILISPRLKNEFIAELLKRNPVVTVKANGK